MTKMKTNQLCVFCWTQFISSSVVRAHCREYFPPSSPALPPPAANFKPKIASLEDFWTIVRTPTEIMSIPACCLSFAQPDSFNNFHYHWSTKRLLTWSFNLKCEEFLSLAMRRRSLKRKRFRSWLWTPCRPAVSACIGIKYKYGWSFNFQIVRLMPGKSSRPMLVWLGRRAPQSDVRTGSGSSSLFDWKIVLESTEMAGLIVLWLSAARIISPSPDRNL